MNENHSKNSLAIAATPSMIRSFKLLALWTVSVRDLTRMIDGAPMTMERMVKELHKLGTIYPSKTLTPQEQVIRAEAYCEALDDCPEPFVAEAIWKYTRSPETFYPAAGVIREMARQRIREAKDARAAEMRKAPEVEHSDYFPELSDAEAEQRKEVAERLMALYRSNSFKSKREAETT